MFYERKVKYLDYLIKQERCGIAGFLKLEARGKVCNITINVSNLKSSDSHSVKVYLIGNGCEKELCSLELLQGKGLKQLLRQDLCDIGRTGISYEALEAVKIPISTDRMIYGVLEGRKGISQKSSPKAAETKDIHIGQVEDINEITVQSTVENVTVENGNTHIEEIYQEEEAITQEKPLMAQEEPEIIRNRKGLQQNSEKEMPLYDDKWKQLWEIYPHITPFRDEREYLSVGPNDFVILPEKYFRMANNSFLLHGYYNYKHLVLKKMEHHGEARYYIGVPGNFYDREKQVAVMFGFESFESLEESACIGDYGYYFMRIDL